MISPEVLHRLNNPIKDDTLNKLESDMSKVLESDNLEDRTKWAQYEQLLQRRQHFQDQLRQPTEIPIVEKPNTNDINESFKEEILGALPKALRSKGELLFKRICSSDVITWDNYGRVSINSSAIPGSNITDLVCDVVRFKKSGSPTGWKQFIEALASINVPQEFIGNPQRRQPLSRPSPASLSSPSPASSRQVSSPRPTFPTLTARRRRRTISPSRPISRLARWGHTRLQ